jgi:hypothetical protein
LLTALLTVFSAATPQHWASTLLFALAALTGLPALVAGAALTAWWASASGSYGAVWIGGAVALVALSVFRRGGAGASGVVGVFGLAGVVVGRQWLVRESLPAAVSVIANVAVLGLFGAALWETGRAHRAPRSVRVALLLLAGVGAARWMDLTERTGLDRLQVAQKVHAEELVVDGLAGQSAALDESLLAAVPDSDRVALSLGWRRALDLGWRPGRPDADVLSVAQELDVRGRGGEARRLLARYPRTAAVDFWRAAWERADGAQDRWRGGMDGEPALGPGQRIVLEWALVSNGVRQRVFRMERRGRACLTAHLDAFEGDPSIQVQLDASAQRWVPAGTLDLGVLERGPHTLRVTYDTDRRDEASGGDRNVWVAELYGAVGAACVQSAR